jgi:nucleoside-diphosphate-sugar epimerase
MARMLVIGGTLFIGRALVEQLLARGDEVVIMHRGSGTPFGARVGEIRCDRNDVEAVRLALAGERFDVVFDNVYDWERGTSGEQVAAAAKAASGGSRLERYVFMSSVAVYGEGGPFDEDDGPRMPSDHPNPYMAQKSDSERALFALHREQGLPVSTIRPAFVHGPYNAIDREAFFWDRILADRPIIVPGDGERTMEWVHSEDVARAAILAATNERANGRAYNLASEPRVTQREFIDLMARIAGKAARVVPVPRESIERAGGGLMAPPFYFGIYIDLPPIATRGERVRAELGLPVMGLEEGLRATFEWYRTQPKMERDYAWEDQLLATV